MKISFVYGERFLLFRGSLDFQGLWQDPRGLSGSELGIIRTAEEMAKLGHDVHLYTLSKDSEYNGIKIHPLTELDGASSDVWISWNDPDLLRGRDGFRVMEQMINSFEFAQDKFWDHIDLYCSPSDSHRAMITGMRHGVQQISETRFTGFYEPDPNTWVTVPLGCDPERYGNPPGKCSNCGRESGHAMRWHRLCSNCIIGAVAKANITGTDINERSSTKFPGRVVYCSSPDRGLHLLLQQWPHIKRAVPHASLKIFYRLRPWIDQLQNAKPWPSINPLIARAYHIEECLRRMQTGYDIEVCDSVSREQIEREMSAAQVLAYPCDTIRWTEGFSCTILECCAARACPVIFDTDALGSIYGDACAVVKHGDLDGFTQTVIRALQDEQFREQTNDKAEALARSMTWEQRTRKLDAVIREQMASKAASVSYPAASSTAPE